MKLGRFTNSGDRQIMLPAMLSVSKYMWIMFHFLKFIVFILFWGFIKNHVPVNNARHTSLSGLQCVTHRYSVFIFSGLQCVTHRYSVFIFSGLQCHKQILSVYLFWVAMCHTQILCLSFLGCNVSHRYSVFIFSGLWCVTHTYSVFIFSGLQCVTHRY